MKKRFPSTAAAVLLLLLSRLAAVTDDVKIKLVDNHAGNSNVYTGRPNASVSITELDADGKPVESWTGTTDAEGKITLPAGHNLSKTYLRARLTPVNQPNVVEGIVVPDHIYDDQSFSFTVPHNGSADVNIQTVSGAVVQHASTDRYGRVFLAAGLPAGAYLISLGSHAQPIGKVEIKQHAGDALERPWQHSLQPMQVQDPPQALKVSEPFSLTGHGFSPNYTDMQVSLNASGKTETPIVLAATQDQLKLASVQQLPPGSAQLTVTNSATGQSTEPERVLLYDIEGHLEQHTLPSGSGQTQLVVRTQPTNLPLKVKATVASGPVDFGGGRKEAEAESSSGQIIFPVHAEKGAGPFQLTWQLLPVALERMSSEPSSQPTTALTQDRDQPAHSQCHCHVAAGGGIAKLKAEKSERPSPDEINVDAGFDNQKDRDDWRTRRRDRPVFDRYLGTVSVTFRINAATVVADNTGDDSMHPTRNARLKVSAGSPYSFQVFRRGQNGKWVPVDSRTDGPKDLRCEKGNSVTFDPVNEEYRVEVWMRSLTDPVPDTTNMDVDVTVSIDPCGHAAHEKTSYQLRFDNTSAGKTLTSIEKLR